MEIKKFEQGETIQVDAPLLKCKMLVVDCLRTAKGWRYELAFMKKDGSANKKKGHRFFYDNYLNPLPL